MSRLEKYLVFLKSAWMALIGQELWSWDKDDLQGCPEPLIGWSSSSNEEISRVRTGEGEWLVARSQQAVPSFYLASQALQEPAPQLLATLVSLLDLLNQEQSTADDQAEELVAAWHRLNFLYEISLIAVTYTDLGQILPRLAHAVLQGIPAEDVILSYDNGLYTATGRAYPSLEQLTPGSMDSITILRDSDQPTAESAHLPPYVHMLTVASLPMDGSRLGWIALVNYPAPDLRPADRQLLTSAVELIGMLIQTNREHIQQVEDARLDLELNIASQFQANFLPASLPEVPGVEFAASLVPAYHISGDFYDIQPVEGGLAVIVGDVAGKGIPAAMLAAMLHATLKSEAQRINQPARLLHSINNLVYEELDRSETFITAFLAILKPEPLELSYASAGHTTTLLWRAAQQEVLQLPSTGLPLGILPVLDLEERQLPIGRGDVLLLYSDGVTEAENPQGRVFGTQALIDLLFAGYPASVGQQLHMIFTALDLHRGQIPLKDDIVLFLARARDALSEEGQITPFVFTAEKKNVRALATHVRQIANSLQFSTQSERNNYLSDLELAVSEIASNIVLHAYRGSLYTGRIQGRVTLLADRVRVDLVDSGQPFASRRSSAPARANPSSDPPTGGYGLALARRLLDVCQYERIPGERNHWVLEKRLPVAILHG